jgi:hypothetical protein
MPEPLSLLDLNAIKIQPPEVWPGGRGYGIEGLRDAINGSVGEVGDKINNMILIFTVAAIGAVFDGSGSVLAAGAQGEVPVPYSAIIQSVVVVADTSGSIEIDILKASFADFPSMTSIVASAPPTLSAAQKSEDTTLTGWTTAITAGDILRFSITSVSTITRAEIGLKVAVAI